MKFKGRIMTINHHTVIMMREKEKAREEDR